MFLDWFTILQSRFSATPCINLYPTTACDAKNDNRKQNTLRKCLELSIKDFYCVFVRTEINLIAFSGPRNCVNTQYAALSGAMSTLFWQSDTKDVFMFKIFHCSAVSWLSNYKLRILVACESSWINNTCKSCYCIPQQYLLKLKLEWVYILWIQKKTKQR